MSGFSGQGKVLIGPRLPSGLPGVLRWIGNASVFRLAQSQDSVERKESYSGNRLPFRRLTKGNGGELTITFDEFSPNGMSYAALGVTTPVAAGSAVTGFAAPTGVTVGDTVALPAKNVSAVVVKDSTAGTPKVVPAGNYTLDEFAGTITFNDVTTGGAYVQPFKVDYTPGLVNVLGAFKLLSTEVYVRMDGINTDDGTRAIFDVFRARLSPAKQIDAISDDFTDFELTGTMLADPTRLSTSAEGQFYSLTTP